MPRLEKVYDKIKAIRVNDEILDRCPKEKKFSTWVKDIISNRSKHDNDVFRKAFQELYSIFEEFSKNPTPAKATELFLSANLELIDRAREALTNE